MNNSMTSRHLQRFAATLTVLVLSASMAACSSGSSPPASETTCKDYIAMSLNAGEQEAVASQYLIDEGNEASIMNEITQAANEMSGFCALGGAEDDPDSKAFAN